MSPRPYIRLKAFRKRKGLGKDRQAKRLIKLVDAGTYKQYVTGHASTCPQTVIKLDRLVRTNSSWFTVDLEDSIGNLKSAISRKAKTHRTDANNRAAAEMQTLSRIVKTHLYQPAVEYGMFYSERLTKTIVIDLDAKDGNLARVQQLTWLLERHFEGGVTLARTGSLGVHFYLFLSDPIDSKLATRAIHHIARNAGYAPGPGILEVFPSGQAVRLPLGTSYLIDTQLWLPSFPGSESSIKGTHGARDHVIDKQLTSMEKTKDSYGAKNWLAVQDAILASKTTQKSGTLSAPINLPKPINIGKSPIGCVPSTSWCARLGAQSIALFGGPSPALEDGPVAVLFNGLSEGAPSAPAIHAVMRYVASHGVPCGMRNEFVRYAPIGMVHAGITDKSIILKHLGNMLHHPGTGSKDLAKSVSRTLIDLSKHTDKVLASRQSSGRIVRAPSASSFSASDYKILEARFTTFSAPLGLCTWRRDRLFQAAINECAYVAGRLNAIKAATVPINAQMLVRIIGSGRGVYESGVYDYQVLRNCMSFMMDMDVAGGYLPARFASDGVGHSTPYYVDFVFDEVSPEEKASFLSGIPLQSSEEAALIDLMSERGPPNYEGLISSFVSAWASGVA